MGFFGDDDFLDMDDMADDAQLSIIDETKIKVLEKLIDTAKKAIDNIKFQETEYDANMAVIDRHIAELRELTQLEKDEDLSNEEVLLKIQEISRSCMTMSQSEVNLYVPEEEDEDSDYDAISDILNSIDSYVESDDEKSKTDIKKNLGTFKKLSDKDNNTENNEDTSDDDDDLF